MAIRLLLFGFLLFRIAAAASPEDSTRISHDGLAIWLKSDAGLKSSKDKTITEWVNESPNGKQGESLVPLEMSPELSSQTWNGNPVVHFRERPGTAIDEIINSGKDYSLFIVRSLSRSLSQAASTDTDQTIHSHPFTPDIVHQRRHNSNGTSEVESGRPRLLSMLKGSGTTKFWANGEFIEQPDANTSDLTGQYASNAMFRGEVAEILLYNRKLSNGERLRVEIYLADKYGIYHPNATWPSTYSSEIQDQIEANSWNEDQAKAYATFEAQHQPVNPMGLGLWLQADKGVESTDQKSVTAWLDQSPSNYDAYLPRGLPPPAIETGSINGKPVIHFDGHTHLETQNVVTRGQDYSIFMVSTLSGDSGPFYNGDSGRSGWGIIKQSYLPADSISMLNGGSGYPTFGGVQNQDKPQLLSATRSQGSIHLYLNGKLAGTSDMTMGDPSGVAYIGSAGIEHNFSGNIAEILVYNRSLSDDDRKQIELYLRDKYGFPAVESAVPISTNPNTGH